MSVQTAQSNESDKQRIEQQIKIWTQAWNVGTGTFDPEPFRDLFAPGNDNISVFDNVQGDVLTLNDIDRYVSTWGPFMSPLPVWSVEMRDLTIQVSGDLAYSTFRLVGTDTRAPDGSPCPFGQYGTHVWRKLPNLGWRIVHEHLTAYDVGNPDHES